MTDCQKKLWMFVAERADSNLEARMLYDELLKQLNMSDKAVIVSITEAEDGVEVRVHEQAYGNAHIIGILERIKYSLLSEDPVELNKEVRVQSDQKYDA